MSKTWEGDPENGDQGLALIDIPENAEGDAAELIDAEQQQAPVLRIAACPYDRPTPCQIPRVSE